MTEDPLSEIDAMLTDLDSGERSHRSYDYADIFQRARNIYQRLGLSDRAKQFQWEVEAWRMAPQHPWTMNRGESAFAPMVTYEDGTQWPDPKAFPADQFDYLAERAVATTNRQIRAHYSDLLWALRRSHDDGRRAFESYAEIPQNMVDASSRATEQFEYQFAITRPFVIALELNDSALLSRARNLLNERLDQVVARGEFRWTLEIAKLMLLHSNRVERSDLERAASSVELAALHFQQHENSILERSTLELATTLRKKLSAEPSSIEELELRQIQSLEREGERHLTDSPMTAAHFFRSALLAYQSGGQAKYSEKVVVLERVVGELHELGKSEAHHFETSFPIDLSHIDQFVDGLLSKPDINPVYALLSLDNIIPIIDHVRQSAEESRDQTPLLYVFPRETIRGNKIVRISHSKEDIFDDIVMEQYEFHIRLGVVQLARLIDRLADAGGWQFGQIQTHLGESAFFANRDRRLLDHALYLYFEHDYVSSVQLLALQVEPALRAILPLLGLPTTITNARYGVTSEKNLEDVLATREIAGLLGEDYVAFVRFVLTDQRGPLVRHATAHGLIDVETCNAQIAHLLVYMILWLTRFAVASESPTGGD